jgi:hypothetical protein
LHRRILTCFVAVFGSFAIDLPASAGTLFVDANLATGANDGSSWVDAFQGSSGLQSALALAVAGDEIWVADGTYRPTEDFTARTISFDLKSGVAILGGFAGGETHASQANPTANISILTGDLADDDINFFLNTLENSYHVVKGAGADATAILDGFTIQSGVANASGAHTRGAGFWMVDGSNGTIRRCRVRHTDVTVGGGAGYVRDSQPTFTECRFEDNQVRTWPVISVGGAFWLQDDATSFTRCVFKNNWAARGGGVYLAGSDSRFSNCLFFHNRTEFSSGGGAFWVGEGSTPRIQNCTVVRNGSYWSVGGGIHASASTVDVTNSIVYGNWATPVGGQGIPSDIAGDVVNVRYSCVGGGYAGTGNTSGPPMFVDLPFDTSLPDFRLQVGSPCIDAGDNAAVPVGVVFDLSGAPRFIDHPAAADVGSGIRPLVDMGALETRVEPIASYCFGDSIQSPCPCSNEAYRGGCSNSLGVGGALTWSGIASLTSDSVVLAASNFTGNSALFVQGTRLSQIPISDGVWCINGSILRLGIVPASSGNATYPTSISVAGGVSAPGVRFYQVSYRDAVGVCAPASTNYTNGVAVIWSP